MFLFLAAISSSAQTTSPHRPVSPKLYCNTSDKFCFHYPSSWIVLGEVFNGDGVVVAPQQKDDRAVWDAITVALVAVPSNSDTVPSLNGIIGQAAKSMREVGQDFQTLQRRELTVAHNPAQILKARYRENSTGRDWIEEVIFVQGVGDAVYSGALKCAPEHLARLEPVLQQIVASWTVPEVLPPGPAPEEEKVAPLPDTLPPASAAPAEKTSPTSPPSAEPSQEKP